MAIGYQAIVYLQVLFCFRRILIAVPYHLLLSRLSSGFTLAACIRLIATCQALCPIGELCDPSMNFISHFQLVVSGQLTPFTSALACMITFPFLIYHSID